MNKMVPRSSDSTIDLFMLSIHVTTHLCHPFAATTLHPSQWAFSLIHFGKQNGVSEFSSVRDPLGLLWPNNLITEGLECFLKKCTVVEILLAYTLNCPTVNLNCYECWKDFGRWPVSEWPVYSFKDCTVVSIFHISPLYGYTDSVGDWSSVWCRIDWTLVRIFFWCPARDTPILCRSLGKKKTKNRHINLNSQVMTQRNETALQSLPSNSIQDLNFFVWI